MPASAVRNIAIDPEELPGLTWPRLFGRERPVELEIGTGKAAFLLRRARALPERDFLGIERANEFYRFAVDRFQRWGLANVRMLRADAADFVQRICPRASLAALHIYHPDPWPKRRHNRRRLFQPEFVDAAVACLAPGGRLAVQTDHAEYFGVIRGMLEGCSALRKVAFEDAAFGTEGPRVATNFEIKYEREGRPMYRLAFVRSGECEPARAALGSDSDRLSEGASSDI